MRRRLPSTASSRGHHRLARRSIASLAVGVLTATLIACVPDVPGSGAAESTLYTGAIPEPADLPAWQQGAVPEMPEPPSDPTAPDYMQQMEAYQEAAAEYAEAVQEHWGNVSDGGAAFSERVQELVDATRQSDEASVAAWQSLLVASGIAVGVGEQAVDVNGMSGFGLPMTESELRLQALAGTGTNRLLLSDFAGVLEELGLEAVGDASLAEELYDDLMSLASRDFAFSHIFLAFNPETFTFMRLGHPRTLPVEDVTLTGSQVTLLLRRLAVEVVLAADEHGFSMDGLQASIRSASRTADAVITPAALLTSSGGVCDPNTFGGETIRKGAGVLGGFVFGRYLDKKGFVDANAVHTLLGALVGAAGMVTNFFRVQAAFEMPNSPLIRTKNREPGEHRDLQVRIWLPERTDEVSKCIQSVLGLIGLDPGEKGGALKGVDVSVTRLGERLQFARGGAGTDTYRQQTNDNGVATFNVAGKPQRERLPSGAEPEEVTSRVRASANLEGSDLWKDLRDAAADAAGGIAGIVFGAMSRMSLAVFEWDAPVRDWTLKAEFDVTLTGTAHGHSAIHNSRTGIAECPDSTVHRSTTGSGTVESTQPLRVIAEYVTAESDGEVMTGMLMYTKGQSLADIREGRNGAELAHLQVDYDITKRADQPGIDPMPPHYQDPNPGGCGDGMPGDSPPVPDCGPRTFMGLATINVLDGELHITADQPVGPEWKHCGWGFMPSKVLSPPSELSTCQNAVREGGDFPTLDTVFNERNEFTVSGLLSCRNERPGSLSTYNFDWTLEFCRIIDGKRAC